MPRLLAIGSSITWGYPDGNSDVYLDFLSDPWTDTENIAVPGGNLEDWANNTGPANGKLDAVTVVPDLISIELGINDATIVSRDGAWFQATLDQLIDTELLSRWPNAQLLFCTVNPLSEVGSYSEDPRQRIADYHVVYDTTRKARQRILPLALFHAVLMPSSGWIDGIHVTVQTHEDYLAPAFAQALAGYVDAPVFLSWPADLPRYPQYPAALTHDRNTVTTPTDVGPQKRRRRYTNVRRQGSVTVTMTEAQLVSFDTFYRDTTRNGVLPFLWPEITLLDESWQFSPNQPPLTSEISKGIYRVQIFLETYL